MTEHTYRNTEYPIADVFTRRWSPRAFDCSQIEEADLMRLFEAARWAPSAFNIQPWRFLFALRDGPDWERFLNLLVPANREWACNCSAIVFILSDCFMRDETGKAVEPAYSHAFDTGAAWGQLALQAVQDGLHTHGIAGLDYEKATAELRVPDGYRIEMAVAVGRTHEQVDGLPEPLREREVPSDRMPIAKLAFAGSFPEV
ncbi:nitroreductase family protein [Aurantiacibacter flavus]|uniref:Nitroreductase family protein n=1 Tax=Aurantiacibacter flavus TaxID=3145232 RepID=A0ABV0D0C7_9SPHN